MLHYNLFPTELFGNTSPDIYFEQQMILTKFPPWQVIGRVTKGTPSHNAFH